MSADDARGAEHPGETIAANAALLRLFKGEYRNSGDRHNDSLFVRERLLLLEDQRTQLRASLAEVEKDTRRLDWLESHFAEIRRTHAGFAWVVPIMPEGDSLHFVKKCGNGDARSALDAAFAAQPGAKGTP